MILYHASPVAGIEVLEPRVSNQGMARVYMSQRRQNVLVYLSNAVEKFCRETGFKWDGSYHKWGSYGFNEAGVLVLDEYYPGATRQTYEGASGYIYSAEDNGLAKRLSEIPFAFELSQSVRVEDCEFVPDAYCALEQARARGDIIMRSYEQNSPQMLAWIAKCAVEEYENAHEHPEYRAFLKSKFNL